MAGTKEFWHQIHNKKIFKFLTSNLISLQSNQQAPVPTLEYWFIDRKELIRGACARYRASKQISAEERAQRSKFYSLSEGWLRHWAGFLIAFTYPAKVRYSWWWCCSHTEEKRRRLPNAASCVCVDVEMIPTCCEMNAFTATAPGWTAHLNHLCHGRPLISSLNSNTLNHNMISCTIYRCISAVSSQRGSWNELACFSPVGEEL